jgi:hypothetical protein
MAEHAEFLVQRYRASRGWRLQLRKNRGYEQGEKKGKRETG